MVDRSGVEPLLSACKADVLPLSLTAHVENKFSKDDGIWKTHICYAFT